MNRGVSQSSPVQQMTADGNLNWWNINTMRPPPTIDLQQAPSHFLTPSHDNQELPYFSQLLLGGLMGEEEAFQVQQASNANSVVDVKQENSASETSYVYSHANQDFHHQTKKQAWSHQLMAAAASSPRSRVTSFSSNMLEFSGNNKADARQQHQDRSSECNSSSATGGALKKARVQPSAIQSTFKVRKEKLGDRITALHQLVSPFGKTDTASVLLESIGYIRFLHAQIEALSLPYLGNGSGNSRQQQPLLNESSMKRKGGTDQQDFDEEPKKDLRSRGLCLVPASCTLQVGGDNGADYWSPAFGGGFR